ncbi:MAG: class II fumarate hydratase [Planctomycetaceae bacterium]|jgi:fumarate hydratase class II|nr:class II fumarate hydratase [Planctomycetaceae bacterium]
MRIEHDTMGAVEVPDGAYYGAQTQRAVENFPISGKTMPPELIHALGLVKWACAKANAELGLLQSGRSPLSDEQIEALQAACLEVAEGKFDDQFPVDVYQTGSGTSTNMNANEVIARRANELCGSDFHRHPRESGEPDDRLNPLDSRIRGNDGKVRIHPNDHVNMGQSTNDIFPTAIHVAMVQTVNRLCDVVLHSFRVLEEKAEKWNHILKIGRTHLADATPMTLGQEFSGLQHQMLEALCMLKTAWQILGELPVGGTAIGTGINSHDSFAEVVKIFLSLKLGLIEVEEGDTTINDGQSQNINETLLKNSPNFFYTNAQRDVLVNAHALIKSAAVTIFNIANNIRWLGSGPRCGFYEVIIPDLQPGSSIMPGKVNPVLCEALMQACARVIGNDQTMTFCGATGGQFQLNIMMPVMADTAIESVKILSGALEVFTEKCLKGLEANEEKCREGVEKSLSMATALNPHIGYEKAAEVAKEAFKTGKTVREVCLEWNIMPPEQLAEVLDPWKMIKPMG